MMAQLPVSVTGASGFVGRHVVSRLLADEQISIRALSRASRAAANPDRVAWIRGDLAGAEEIPELIQPGGAVVHIAFSSGPGTENLTAAARLADAAIRAGAVRFVHMSTALVVGRCGDEIVDEETPCRPVTQYEREKLAIERLLEEKLRGHVDLCILRPTAVFGAGGANLRKLASFLATASDAAVRLRMSLMGPRRMNLLAAENLAEAVAHTLRLAGGRDSFIVNDGDQPGGDYLSVAGRLMEGMGQRAVAAPIDLSFALKPALRLAGRSLYNPRTTFFAARLRGSGYRPAVAFEEAVRRFGALYAPPPR